MNPGRQTVHVITVIASVLSLAGCTSNTHAGETLGGLGCGNHCPSSPEFLYATSPDHVLAFTIDQSTGALSSSLTTAGPNQSSGMTSTVTLGHLYVSDFQNDTVDGFSVNSSNGALAPIPFSVGGTPPGAGGLSSIISVSTYMYGTDLNAGTVTGFAFDSSSGKLTAVPGSPLPAGNTPVQAVQAGSQGKFLYVSNLNEPAGGISAFTIDFNTERSRQFRARHFRPGPQAHSPDLRRSW